MEDFVNLNGRKIIVTGASSGIGRETAILLSKHGAKVVLMARNREALQETLSQMEGEGHHVISVDLSQLETIKEAVLEAVSYDEQKLYGLVHCAGKTHTVSLRMLKYANLDEVFRVNFYSFIELCKCFSEKKNSINGGSIIAISSVASHNPQKGKIAYSSSKAALNAAVMVLSKELAVRGIRVNAILPGFVRTKMSEDFFLKAGENANVNQLLGIGEPIDVANMVAFLLSDASRFITGSLYNVDGGKEN